MLLAMPVASGMAAEWAGMATVSATLGAKTNRLCVGEGYSTDARLGCPSYAPSLSTAGHVSITGNVSANKFIGDGSGLTGISTATGDRIVSGSTNAIAYQDRSLTISTAGTQRVVVGENGYVGIGTATPGSQFSVSGTGQLRLGGAYPRLTLEPTHFGTMNLWNIDNDGAVGNMRFFTETHSPLNAGSSGVVHMVITSESRVGIGRNAGAGWQPYTTLDVGADGGATQTLRTRDTLMAVGSRLGGIRFDANDSNTADAAYGASIEAFAAGPWADGGAGSPADLAFATTPAMGGGVYTPIERMRISSGGFVGVGTDTPSTTLHIVGRVSVTDAIQVGTSSLTCGAGIPGAIRYQGTSLQYCNGSNWTTLGTSAGLTGTGSATAVAFWNSANGLTYDDQFYWDATNNRLGIGTNNPSYALEVSVSGINGVIISNTSSGVPNASNLFLSRGDAANGFAGVVFATRGVQDWVVNVPGGSNDLRVWSSGAVGELARFTMSGKMGVGTQSPTATLTVSGTISATNAIQLGQNTIACASGVSGSIRYNTTSNTVQFCNGDGWVSLASGTTAGSMAEGDRITSGTLAVVANSATSYVSLSTNGTTWGYFNSGNSYLPTLVANRVSSTNISATVATLSSGNIGSVVGGGGNMISSGSTVVSVSSGGIVYTNGKLGVGTVTPTTKLQVVGTDTMLADIKKVGGNNVYLTLTDDSGMAEFSGSGGGIHIGGAAAKPIWFRNATYTTRMVIGETGLVGIGVASPSHILQINGQGRATNSAWATSSDRRVKEDIHTITGGLAAIEKLRPVTFHYTKEYRNGNKDLEGVRRGFIAQEVEKVLPDAVSQGVEKVGKREIADFRILGNSDFVPLLVSAVKELKASNDNSNARFEAFAKAANDNDQKMREEIDHLRRELKELKQANKK